MKPSRGVKRVKKPAAKFHHGDLYEAAVAVASRELDAHGYAALTLAAVAKRLGVTRPALYRHFADKRALLAEVAQRRFIGFEAAMTEAVLAADDPVDAIYRMGGGYFRFAFENPEWFRLQFFAPPDLRPMPDLERTPARYYEHIIGHLAALVGEEENDVERAYLSLWAQMHGIASLMVERVLGPETTDAQYFDYGHGALRSFVDGLAAQARERSVRRKKRPRP